MTDHGRKYGDKTSYPICVWNGILDHCQKIGLALWVFLWCLDKITVEKDGIGWIFGKAPVRVSRIAQDFGICEKTVRVHLNRLKAFGYITTKKTPFGLIIGVKNSRKIWAPSPQRSGKNLPESSTGSGSFIPESGRNLPESPVGTYRSKEDKAVDKAIDAAQEASAAWRTIGTDKLGTPRFRSRWEFLFAHRNGNSVADAMERCIVSCQEARIPIPKPFYDAKRKVERKEGPSTDHGENVGLSYLPAMPPLPCKS